MFRKTVILLFFAVPFNVLAVSGTITSDATWGPGLVQVTGKIIVDTNATLTVVAGTRIEVQAGFNMYVVGRLQAVGTATDSIVFTAADTTRPWTGIRFVQSLRAGSSRDSSNLSCCRISYCRTVTTTSTNEIDGAALYCAPQCSSRVIVDHSTICNNYSSKTGGGVSGGPHLLIRFCRIVSNTAYTDGGGASGSMILENCYIGQNKARGNGGGVMCGNNAIVRNCVITQNQAYVGGGIAATFAHDARIVGDLIVADSAYWTGGVDFTYSYNAIMANCTITRNRTTTNGNGLNVQNSTPSIVNTIIFPDRISLFDQNSQPSFTNCCIFGGYRGLFLGGLFTGGFNGGYANSISDNPRFIDTLKGDYRLSNGSPCVDKGADPTSLSLGPLDAAGLPRIAGARIDMGAFEYQPAAGDPLVRITAPNGGEKWNAGTAHTIQWHESDNGSIVSCSLWVSLDNGQSYSFLGKASDTSFTWNIPDSLATFSAKIGVLVQDNDGNQCWDASDSAFTIVDVLPPSVTLSTCPTTPLVAGDPKILNYSATDNQAVSLRILSVSLDSGATWKPVDSTRQLSSWLIVWPDFGRTSYRAIFRLVAWDSTGNSDTSVCPDYFTYLARPRFLNKNPDTLTLKTGQSLDYPLYFIDPFGSGTGLSVTLTNPYNPSWVTLTRATHSDTSLIRITGVVSGATRFDPVRCSISYGTANANFSLIVHVIDTANAIKDAPSPARPVKFDLTYHAALDGSALVYSLTTGQAFSLEIFDLKGRLVWRKFDEHPSSGVHTLRFSGDIPLTGKGVYLARLIQGEKRKVAAVVLQK